MLSVLAGSFPVLQWHGDTFELPAGAVHLGRSIAYANQAFRVGEAAYGLQFHLEVTGEMLEEWSQVPAYVASLEATLGRRWVRGALPRLRPARRRWPDRLAGCSRPGSTVRVEKKS